MQPSRDISRLIEIMAALRNPDGGCPWDLEQDFSSIRHYTIEEAYEVSDAIERQDFGDLREELGDLLLQPIYHAQMASEAGHFDIGDVIEGITEKLIRRHPHVFGDAGDRTADEQNLAWEAIKAEERKAKAKHGLLDDVPVGLPALTRAAKLTKRAARVGFDWPSVHEVLDKLDEETEELKVEIARGDVQKSHEELGDVLFVLANLARKLDVEPESALRMTNAKFVRRFETIETELAKIGKTPDQSDLDEMDALWNAAKQAERENS